MDLDVEVETRRAADRRPEQLHPPHALELGVQRRLQILDIRRANRESPGRAPADEAGDRHALEHSAGVRSCSSTRSLNVPGSPSSALQTM